MLFDFLELIFSLLGHQANGDSPLGLRTEAFIVAMQYM